MKTVRGTLKMVCWIKKAPKVSEETKLPEKEVIDALKELEREKGHDFLRDASIDELAELVKKRRKREVMLATAWEDLKWLTQTQMN